jgi:hypothetical protein
VDLHKPGKEEKRRKPTKLALCNSTRRAFNFANLADPTARTPLTQFAQYLDIYKDH